MLCNDLATRAFRNTWDRAALRCTFIDGSAASYFSVIVRNHWRLAFVTFWKLDVRCFIITPRWARLSTYIAFD